MRVLLDECLPKRLKRELVGHEFNDDEDRTYAVREMCELGARRVGSVVTADDVPTTQKPPIPWMGVVLVPRVSYDG